MPPIAPTLAAVALGIIVGTAAVKPLPAQGVFGPGILSSREVVGGTGGLAMGEDRTQMSSSLAGPQRNTDPTGNACLSVYAHSEQQTINKMIYNHVLLLNNHCSREIRIRACYYKTDSCQEISVNAYTRKSYVFGVFTTSGFRFAYREYVR
jgi:hypothetical protein